MLSASRRLSRIDFKQLESVPSRIIQGRLFSARVFSAPHKPARFAVVTAGRVSSRAVDRNRIRRRVYTILSKSSVPASGALVFYAKPPAARSAPDAIQADILDLLGRAGVLY